MRFLILGAGSLGGYFGARLLKGGADVTFLVRPARADQLRRDGLVVKAQDGEIRLPAKTIQKGEVAGPYDVVLLCCKAYDLDTAMEAIAPAVGERTAIVPVLNGIRHVAALEKRFGAGRVLGGLTAVNAALMPTGEIVQSAMKVDMNVIGELGGEQSLRCTAIQQAFAAGGVPVTVSGQITEVMWHKFYAFSCIAAVASLTRSRAGGVAETKAGPALVSAVIDECAKVLAAEGIEAPAQITGIVRGLYGQAGSTYGPSMLIDMEDGRPTEGEHTIGDMVERADRHGIHVPVLTAALCNLQVYEAGRALRRAAASS